MKSNASNTLPTHKKIVSGALVAPRPPFRRRASDASKDQIERITRAAGLHTGLTQHGLARHSPCTSTEHALHLECWKNRCGRG
jgi:hypothetical protein